MRVLIVDDDSDILGTVADQLELLGIEADFARSGQQAVTLAEQQRFDVIVLDVMMPGGDGLTACRRLRAMGCTSPILFLTARDALEDKIEGFEVGGDDYLVKPFAMRELLLRIQALSRRISKAGLCQLRCADLIMDTEQAQVTRAGVELKLNPIQYRILHTLLRNYPRVVERDQLESEVWGEEQIPDSDALRSHLYQLRQIIDKPFATPLLETVRGQGYRLRDRNASASLES